MQSNPARLGELCNGFYKESVHSCNSRISFISLAAAKAVSASPTRSIATSICSTEDQNWHIIDTGVGRDTPAIAAQIEAAGFDPRDISKIFVTHLHLDHAGGAAELQQLCGAEIIASQDVAGWLETGDEVAASLVAARQTGMYPLENRLRPVASATVAADGDVINVGVAHW